MAARKNVRFRMLAEDDTGPGLRSVSRRMKRLGTTAKVALGNFISQAAIGGIRALRSGVTGLLDEFDKLAKRARQLQINPTFLRDLSGASNILGFSVDQLTKVVVKLREAAGGLTDDSVGGKALETLGINLKEFAKLDAGDQISAVVKGLAEIDNATARTAAATAIAGQRLGGVLLQLAETGNDVFDQILARQREFGSEAIKTFGPWAEEANDAFSRILFASENAWAKSTSALLAFIFESEAGLKGFSIRWAKALAKDGLILGPWFQTLEELKRTARRLPETLFGVRGGPTSTVEERTGSPIGQSRGVAGGATGSFGTSKKAETELTTQTKQLTELVNIARQNSGSTFN